ncbi:unnamed protein product [Prorocentrum cordatum]|uniref:Uncharacterized protein n=1 Tax=Prorocentrum cordatum TaxID=2364126 RepID=A0ABN9RS68_9DINO|nr:unnamed protein product [Polarella glacialis]
MGRVELPPSIDDGLPRKYRAFGAGKSAGAEIWKQAVRAEAKVAEGGGTGGFSWGGAKYHEFFRLPAGPCFNGICAKVHALEPFDGLITRSLDEDLVPRVDGDAASAFGATEHGVRSFGRAAEVAAAKCSAWPSLPQTSQAAEQLQLELLWLAPEHGRTLASTQVADEPTPLLFCLCCGYYAQNRLRKVAAKCPRPNCEEDRSSARKVALRRLRSGLHPKRDAPASRAEPEASITRDGRDFQVAAAAATAAAPAPLAPPAASARPAMPGARPQVFPEAASLVDLLAEQAQPQGLLPRAASTASAASLETSPLAAAIADGARQRSAGSDGAAPAPPEALEQEVCTAEHEVQVLRGEVAAADREARQLHQLAREADRRLLLMADQTAKLSARVESLHSARSGSGVQEAAAEQMAEQTAALRRRLAWQEAELAKKDDEIAGRRLALEEARALLQDRRRQLAADDHGLGLEPPAASDAPARDRTQGIDAWVADMKASLERSKADAALLRERREDLRKQQAVQEQIDSLGLLLERAVARSQGSRGEIDKRRRRVEALEREARLLAASERLRRSKAEQQRLALEQESRELEDRIQQERARKDSRLQQASVRAYDQAEAESAALSGQLQALTVCMRDVYTVLQGSAAAGRADFGRAAVQDELAAALQDGSLCAAPVGRGDVIPRDPGGEVGETGSERGHAGPRPRAAQGGARGRRRLRG